MDEFNSASLNKNFNDLTKQDLLDKLVKLDTKTQINDDWNHVEHHYDVQFKSLLNHKIMNNVKFNRLTDTEMLELLHGIYLIYHSLFKDEYIDNNKIKTLSYLLKRWSRQLTLLIANNPVDSDYDMDFSFLDELDKNFKNDDENVIQNLINDLDKSKDNAYESDDDNSRVKTQLTNQLFELCPSLESMDTRKKDELLNLLTNMKEDYSSLESYYGYILEILNVKGPWNFDDLKERFQFYDYIIKYLPFNRASITLFTNYVDMNQLKILRMVWDTLIEQSDSYNFYANKCTMTIRNDNNYSLLGHIRFVSNGVDFSFENIDSNMMSKDAFENERFEYKTNYSSIYHVLITTEDLENDSDDVKALLHQMCKNYREIACRYNYYDL